MVKKIKSSSRKTVKQLEKDICKHKNLRANLDDFVRKLHKKHQNITTKQYLIRIHNFINNFKTVAKKACDLTKPTYDYVRICKECGNWKNRSKLIECSLCEDFYHISCIDEEVDDVNTWACGSCQNLNEMVESRQKYLDRHYGVAQKSIKTCNKCKNHVDKQLTSCIKCGNHYHSSCFGDWDKSSIVCKDCHIEIEDQIKNRKSLKQKTLHDYYLLKDDGETFKIQTKSEASTIGDELTINYSYSFNLKPPISLKKNEIEEYKKQLLYAIYSKKMEYSEELIFESQLPKDARCQDPTLDFINQKDEKAYIQYKKQPIGPYKFIMVEGMGYDVKADKSIPKGTIICQYVGQVITKRKTLQYLDNDSLMELMIGVDADSSLIIKPEKYTNMARFINGINNSNAESRKKANVKTIRFNIVGRPTILLYASRKINKGQSLLYDYNAGGLDKFSTSQFL